MKKLLFLSFCFGFDLLALAIIFTNMHTVKSRANNSQALAQEINLNEYFDKQGESEIKSDVLGETTFADVINELATPSASVQQKTTPTPSPKSQSQLRQPKVGILTIAVMGDSMVDTLGPGVPHLKSALQVKLLNTKLNIINHGVGASNIEYGITRLINSYTYLNENRGGILSSNPDILVVESFAYNHWENTQSDINRHWLDMANIVKIVKDVSPKTKIIFAASIAPFCPTYTDGSANLPAERKYSECQTVKVYLQNTVNFATSQKYPLADAYHASLNDTDGNPKYINQGDHIHPSDAGKVLFASKVAEAIIKSLNN